MGDGAGRNPQQPEARRRGLGAEMQASAEVKADPNRPDSRPHGTDKGNKGGGEGGGVPPAQDNEFPG